MFCNSCTFHPVKKSARQPAPAPPQPEQLPNCDANLMLERYTPNHMRFMNVPMIQNLKHSNRILLLLNQAKFPMM